MTGKRVLIVANYFPHMRGTAVLRPLKFARYLRDSGWEPVVLTTESAYSAYEDSSFLKDLPEDLRVIRRKDPLSPVLKRLQNHKLVPDESIMWALQSVLTAKRLIEQARPTDNPFDCIYTTSGPYSTHVLGLLLKRWVRIPWVADFQGPWTQHPYYAQTGVRRRFEEWLEEQVFEHADAVVTVTDGFAQMFRKKHPKFAAKVQVIRNGVDPADFPLVQVRKPTERLTLFCGGTVYPKQTLAALLQALSAGLRYGKLKSNQIRVQFAGALDEPGHTEHRDLVRELGLQTVVEELGSLPYSQVLEKTQQADALLLLGERTGRENPSVAGELYEYLYANKPTLALVESGDAAGLILAEDAGVVVDPGDVSGILQRLLELVERQQRKFQTVCAPTEMRIRPDFTCQGQTALLSALFDSLGGALHRRMDMSVNFID